MKGLTIGNNSLSKYFRFLKNFNNESKKELIKMLNDSMEREKDTRTDFKTLYDAWLDSRDAEEIIKDIKDSRLNKIEISELHLKQSL